jgi:chemotaxis response regulator CheB
VLSTLEQNPRFEVCGEAQDGFEAIEEAQKLKPDVVILNVGKPVINGFGCLPVLCLGKPPRQQHSAVVLF